MKLLNKNLNHEVFASYNAITDYKGHVQMDTTKVKTNRSKGTDRPIQYILYKIIRERVGSECKLNQKDICNILASDYEIEVDRRTVKDNMLKLSKEDNSIVIETRDDRRKSGESREPDTYYYYDPDPDKDFTESEIKLLIDGVMCSRYIDANNCKNLVNKISALGGKKQSDYMKNVATYTTGKTGLKQLFLNIEVISEAIDKKKPVIFTFNQYGADKKLHEKYRHIVSPYQFIIQNQRYYLMGWHYKKDWEIFFRADRITNVRILDDEGIKSLTPIDIKQAFKDEDLKKAIYGTVDGAPVSDKEILEVIYSEKAGKPVTIDKILNTNIIKKGFNELSQEDKQKTIADVIKSWLNKKVDQLTPDEIAKIASDIHYKPISEVKEFQDGIDYDKVMRARPYMYNDRPEWIEFIADDVIIDDLIDRFGYDVTTVTAPCDGNKKKIIINASPQAMHYIALQYLPVIEIIKPQSLREKIRSTLLENTEKYT